MALDVASCAERVNCIFVQDEAQAIESYYGETEIAVKLTLGNSVSATNKIYFVIVPICLFRKIYIFLCFIQVSP